MAKKDRNLNPLYDSMISSAAEVLTPEEIQATQAEQEGLAPAAPEAPPAEPDAKVEGEEGAPKEQLTQSETPEEPKAKKPLSRAEERIRELVEERNAKEREAQELKEKWARLEERQKLISEQAEIQRREEESRRYAAEQAELRKTQRPDPNLDPVGAELFDTREELRQLQAWRQQAERQVQEGFAQSRAQADMNQFTAALTADIRAGQAKYSDYNDAANYATRARVDLWKSLGNSEEESWKRVQAEALAIAKDAIDHGLSPSDIYYQQAKQWGYQPKDAPSRGATQTPQTQERLKQIEKGQKVQGFGGQPNIQEADDIDISNLSPAELADMSEERFLTLLRNPRSAAVLQRRISTMEGLV